MERFDDFGRWVSGDGVTWVLVEPSETWLASIPAESVEPVSPTPEDQAQVLLAAIVDSGISPERLVQALGLAVGVTEPDAVEALAASVVNDSPGDGVAVLAESALRAIEGGVQ